MSPSTQTHKAIRRITVPAIGDGYRLDALLTAYLSHASRQSVGEAIKLGLVYDAEHSICTADRSVSTGDVFALDLSIIARRLLAAPALNVISEDDELLILNKAANQLVHPAGGCFDWTVIDVVRMLYPQADIDLCHRLDKQTSGVLVLTKNKKTNALIKQEFESRRVFKKYRAIISGRPSEDTFSCSAPIGHANDDSRVRRMITLSGQSAQTTFVVKRTCEGFAEVECMPITGRSHQIRVHLAHLGLPIVGDRLYQNSDAPLPPLPALEAVHPERHALHCEFLEFSYPSDQSRQFTAKVPQDMRETWQECASNVRC